MITISIIHFLFAAGRSAACLASFPAATQLSGLRTLVAFVQVSHALTKAGHWALPQGVLRAVLGRAPASADRLGSSQRPSSVSVSSPASPSPSRSPPPSSPPSWSSATSARSPPSRYSTAMSSSSSPSSPTLLQRAHHRSFVQHIGIHIQAVITVIPL